jgi:SAM-dependent methyltransferase
MPDRMFTTPRQFARQLIGVVTVTILLSGVWSARAQTTDTGHVFRPCVRTRQILELAQYLAAANGAPDSYARVVKAAFDSPAGDATNMTAFEESRSFIYAVAGLQSHEGTAPDGKPAERTTRWVRRLIILNPSTFIVDDEFPAIQPPGMSESCLDSQTAPRVSGRAAHLSETSGEITSEVLFPRKAAYQVKRTGNTQEPERYLLETTDNSPGGRILQVLQISKGPKAGGPIQSELVTATGEWKLTATADGRIFRLTLPPPTRGAGEISIASLDGKTLLSSRPFPSGILPHGPEGNRLLALWDSDYQGTAPAMWDIGRPADELQKVVAGGKVGQCRVVDMCCGSGTDAIYLARQGFDVTAIDVAPTALSQAREKARKAGVSVKWVLADILAPPDLQPFDFLYDRGCYHVVRDQNLAAYVETVRKFSRAGTQFLLLAARRDEQARDAPEGVTEEELRFDFLTLFDVEWLREIRLESNRPGIGPPGWSALLTRNKTP